MTAEPLDAHRPIDGRRANAERDFLRALSAVGRARRIVGAELHRRTGLLPTQVAYLFSISECDGVRINALAEEHLVDQSVASRQVAPLEKQGLVVRRPDPVDGRASLLSLSEAGREVIARVVEAYHELTVPLLQEWSTEEIAQAAAVLQRIADAHQIADVHQEAQE